MLRSYLYIYVDVLLII